MRIRKFEKTPLILGALVIGFLTLRSFFVLLRPNISHPEEALLGILIKHILEGRVTVSIFDYFSPHEGGTVAAALTAVPWCMIFGVSTATLRVISLFHGVIILGALFMFVNRFWGRFAAIIAALLYILAPPSFSHYTYLFFNSEYFIMFFNTLIMWFFLSIFFVPGNRKKPALYCALGFVCGFGIYYLFSSLLFTAWILLSWFLIDKLFFKRKEFLFFFVFFFFGLSPFAYYLVTHWQIMANDLAANPLHYVRVESFPDLSEKLVFFPVFFVRNLVDSFHFEFFTGRRFGVFCNYVYFIVLFLACFDLARARAVDFKKIFRSLIPVSRYDLDPGTVRPESLLAALPALFFLFCFFSGYFNRATVQYRYFFPLYPVFFIFIALFISRHLPVNKGMRTAAAVIPAVLLMGTCLYANIRIIGTRDLWAEYDLNGLIADLRTQGIRHAYSTFFYQWQIAFESNEDIVVSTQGIRYSYFPGVDWLVDWSKYAERFKGYEKEVDAAVGAGLKYAYIFDTRLGLRYPLIFESYCAEKGIGYAKKSIGNDFIVYSDITGIVRPRDVDFNGKW